MPDDDITHGWWQCGDCQLINSAARWYCRLCSASSSTASKRSDPSMSSASTASPANTLSHATTAVSSIISAARSTIASQISTTNAAPATPQNESVSDVWWMNADQHWSQLSRDIQPSIAKDAAAPQIVQPVPIHAQPVKPSHATTSAIAKNSAAITALPATSVATAASVDKSPRKPPPPAQSFQQYAHQKQTEWICHRCTLLNSSTAAVCAACDASKVESLARAQDKPSDVVAGVRSHQPTKSPKNPFDDDELLLTPPGQQDSSISSVVHPNKSMNRVESPASTTTSQRVQTVSQVPSSTVSNKSPRNPFDTPAVPPRPTTASKVASSQTQALDPFDPFAHLISPTISQPLGPLSPLPSVITLNLPSLQPSAIPPVAAVVPSNPVASHSADSAPLCDSTSSSSTTATLAASVSSLLPQSALESPLIPSIDSPPHVDIIISPSSSVSSSSSSSTISPPQRVMAVCREIVQSETVYRDYLLACQAFYHEPMKKSREKLSLTEQQISTIFSNIPVLAQFHSLLLKDLSNASVLPEVALIRYVEYMKLYVEYVGNYSIACQTLTSLANSSKTLRTFLAAQYDKYPQHLDLSSLLIMPVQRLPRYVLLLRELRKFAPSDRHQGIDQAIERVEAICQRINQAQSEAERLHSITLLQRRLKWPAASSSSSSPIPDLFAPSRKLLREDDVKIVDDEQSSTASVSSPHSIARLLLFNDALLITSSTSSSGSAYVLCWAPLSSTQILPVNQTQSINSPPSSECIWCIRCASPWFSTSHSPLWMCVTSTNIRDDWQRFHAAAISVAVNNLPSPPRQS